MIRERTTCILFSRAENRIIGESRLSVFCGPPDDSCVCYPCVKSNVIPVMKLVLVDVGHGDFMFLFNGPSLFVVDCGLSSSVSHHVQTVVSEIQSKQQDSALLISHLHKDHYNLLKYFGNQFFRRIWVPIIPLTEGSRRVGEAILRFFFLALTSDFLEYRILLPPIFNGFRDKVRFLKKGSTFCWAGINWEVLWPDLKNPVFKERVLQKVEPLEERLKAVSDISEKYGFDELFEKIAQNISSILGAENDLQSDRFYRQLSDSFRQCPFA